MSMYLHVYFTNLDYFKYTDMLVITLKHQNTFSCWLHVCGKQLNQIL